MDQRGAPSAYRGYRLQALYTLARVLEPGDSARSVFQPEGKEDLAVWDANGNLREVIQVKSYPNLTLSHLTSDGSTSFLHRAVELLKRPDAPDIKLVSFGGIGPELRLAWDGSEPEKTRISGKLSEDGFRTSDIQAIFCGVEAGSSERNPAEERYLIPAASAPRRASPRKPLATCYPTGCIYAQSSESK